MNDFDQLGLSKDLLVAISRMGFSAPTQIQQKTIPLLLDGKDVIGESSTGSGKTVAFGCSLVQHGKPNSGIQAVVLTPTRELAEQVKGVLSSLASNKKLRIVPVYGGVAMNPQINALRSADIVVATPGRLLDHMQRGTIMLDQVRTLVLYAADRMLDMGFVKDMEEVMRACKSRSQTMFFSATISKDIERLSKKYMRDPVRVMAEKQVDPSKLRQTYYDISNKLKMPLLATLIKHDLSERVMVFCNMRSTVDKVTKVLQQYDVQVVAIHGGFTQAFRAKALDRFMRGRAQVLVCTDVAARGIHIDNVEHIYNFDLPKDPTDYVHRIGRTARAGEEGLVSNIVGEVDKQKLSLIRKLNRAFVLERRDVPELMRIDMKPVDGGQRNARAKERRGRQRDDRSSRAPRDETGKKTDGVKKPFKKRKFSSKGPKRSFSSGGPKRRFNRR